MATPSGFQMPLTRFLYQAISTSLKELRAYNPSKISWQSRKRMRLYPQLKFGLKLVKLAVLSAERSVECEDDDAKALVDSKFLKPLGSTTYKKALQALEYGCQPLEFVWQPVEEGGRIWWVVGEVRDPDPEYCYPLVDETGDYVGFEQMTGGTAPVNVPAERTLWVVWEQRHGNWYGEALTDAAYPDWYNAELLKLYMMQQAERFGGPFIKVFYPTLPDEAQNKLDADTLGKSVRNFSIVSIPRKPGTADEPQWDVTRELEKAPASHFIEQLDWINTQMFRSMGIPDLVATTTETGAYSLGETRRNILNQGVDSINIMLDSMMTEHVVKKMLQYNYPNPPECEIKSEPLSSDKRDFILEIVKEVIKQKASQRVIDAAEAELESMGWDLPEEEEVAEEEPEPEIIEPEAEPMPQGEGDIEEPV